MFRRIDDNGNGTFDIEHYHLYDVQFSSRIVIDDAADIIESVDYTPYGVASHHHKWDVDGDGDFDGSDRTIVLNLSGVCCYPIVTHKIDETGYRAEADLNRDGTIDANDNNIVSGQSDVAAISAGLISEAGSTTDNQIGYDGYCFNAETMQYSVRYRVNDPELGQWIERDPSGYVDGMNLYGFVATSPTNYNDPTGLNREGSSVPSFIPGKRALSPLRVRDPGVYPFNVGGRDTEGRRFPIPPQFRPKPSKPPKPPKRGPGAEPQDFVCSNPAGILNLSPCAKGCFYDHGKCFEQYGCTDGSWDGSEGEDCFRCNTAVVACIAGCAATEPGHTYGKVFEGGLREWCGEVGYYIRY